MKLCVSNQSPEVLTPEHLANLRQAGVEDAGLALHEIMPADLYNCTEIATGRPDAEAHTELLLRFVEDLGRSGVTATTCAWHTGGTYATRRAVVRGCDTRAFRLSEALRNRTRTSGRTGGIRKW